MPVVTKETLLQLLENCIYATLEHVQHEIADSLPGQVSLTLEGFEQYGKELSIDEVMAFLYRDGSFPGVVDVAVRGVRDGRTLVWIRPSGHGYVSDLAQTWNIPEGMGPFKSLGLMLPLEVWKRPRPLSIRDLKDAGER